MKKIFAIAVMALTSLAYAGDVTGKWVASMETPNGARETTFTFKADGAKLTGSVSGRQGDTQIQDGKVDGDNISFLVKMEIQGNEVKIDYTGKVEGDSIKMKSQREGTDRVQEFVAKKSM